MYIQYVHKNTYIHTYGWPHGKDAKCKVWLKEYGDCMVSLSVYHSASTSLISGYHDSSKPSVQRLLCSCQHIGEINY